MGQPPNHVNNFFGEPHFNALGVPIAEWPPLPIVDELDIESEAEFVSVNGDHSDDSDDDSTMDVADYEFTWAQPLLPDVTEEMIERVNAIPVADLQKCNPLSLQKLCVVKILTDTLAVHQAHTHEFMDSNGNQLENVDGIKKLMVTFSDSQCETDVQNLYECCCITSPIADNWFPHCSREFQVLHELGIVMALACIDNPVAQLLARNAYNTFLERVSFELPHYYGYAPRYQNLRDLTIALGGAINRRKKQFVKVILEVLNSNAEQDRVIHNHALAFVKKYLLPDYVDVPNAPIVASAA